MAMISSKRAMVVSPVSEGVCEVCTTKVVRTAENKPALNGLVNVYLPWRRLCTHENEVHVEVIMKALQHRGVVRSAFVQHDTPDASVVPELLADRVILVLVFVAASPVLALRPRAYGW